MHSRALIEQNNELNVLLVSVRIVRKARKACVKSQLAVCALLFSTLLLIYKRSAAYSFSDGSALSLHDDHVISFVPFISCCWRTFVMQSLISIPLTFGDWIFFLYPPISFNISEKPF